MKRTSDVGIKKMKTFATVMVIAVAVLGGTAPGAEAGREADHDYEPPAPGSYTLPVIKAAADGGLLDTKGKPVRLAELTRGRITVMSFIYTRCAAARACPYATGC